SARTYRGPPPRGTLRAHHGPARNQPSGGHAMDDSHCRQYFLVPQETSQRRYEALRAIFLEGVPLAAVADRFGYKFGRSSRWPVASAPPAGAAPRPPFPSGWPRTISQARPRRRPTGARSPGGRRLPGTESRAGANAPHARRRRLPVPALADRAGL